MKVIKYPLNLLKLIKENTDLFGETQYKKELKDNLNNLETSVTETNISNVFQTISKIFEKKFSFSINEYFGSNLLVELWGIVKELNLSKDIDLISINIEGGEYSLLDRIIESGFISHIKELQVQFHTTVPNAAKERKRIVEKLLQTHNSSYSYPFVWEGFVRKS